MARVCVCGHAKEALGLETHYYGDRTMKSPCMVTGCSCATYTPDIAAEVRSKKNARTAIANARADRRCRDE